MITARDALVEKLRRLARRDLLAFYQYCWWMPTPLRIGRHTRELCARLTRATFDFLAGKNTYLIVSVPFRHGKSDIVSRAFPAWFSGVCAAAQPNVILSGYGSSLVKGFSDKVQEIVRSDSYRRVFPGVEVDPEKTASDEWKLKGSQATVYAQGLGGAITGKGANLIVVDDYCKNWEEAESKTVREKTYNSFSADLSTRTNAPAHIIVICATRWHEDDVIGRLEKRMKDDPTYTRWEELVFPAQKDGPGGWDTLFPELYDRAWYDFQRKNLGPHAAAALLDCDPRSSGTCVFLREWIETYVTEPDLRRLKIFIFVDGAKAKTDSADFTGMLAVGKAPDGCCYLLDGVHARLNLAEKIDALYRLRADIRARGGRVSLVWWEQVGPMSDVESLRMEMDRRMERFQVRELHHNQNKDFRIRRLVVPLSKGELVMPLRLVRQRVNRDGSVESYDLVKELVEDEMVPYTGQDSTPHDDLVDCLADIMDDVVLKEFTPPTGTAPDRYGMPSRDADAGRHLFAR